MDMYNYPEYSDFSSDFQSGLSEFLGSAVGAGIITALVFALIILIALAVVMYIFESLAIYRIAKNRGIENPWLAWIPIGSAWIVGKIGDYYLEREGNGGKNLAVWLICIQAAGVVLSWVPFLPYVTSVAATVLMYICIYKFYQSVAPKNATVMLVLSIIFSVALPFILFANRNKLDPPAYYDGGQPPYGQPYQNQQPYQNGQPYNQQPYQNGQPDNQAPYQQPPYNGDNNQN